MLGWSTEDFALRFNCSAYRVAGVIEKGTLRAADLYEVASLLKVPVGYFFDGLDGSSLPPLLPSERIQLELSRNIARLPEYQQRALCEYIKTIANA